MGEVVEIQTGVLMTIKEYFERNPQSIAIINNDPNRRGVIINGALIEIGSPLWNSICNTKLYHDQLLGEIRLYK